MVRKQHVPFTEEERERLLRFMLILIETHKRLKAEKAQKGIAESEKFR